jgi:hypothetical protein
MSAGLADPRAGIRQLHLPVSVTGFLLALMQFLAERE